MRIRLPILVMLLATSIVLGCTSSPLRSWRWWREQSVQVNQPTDKESTTNHNIENLSAAPPKLPAGIELPPEPVAQPTTLPSGGTSPNPAEAGSTVIFASATP